MMSTNENYESCFTGTQFVPLKSLCEVTSPCITSNVTPTLPSTCRQQSDSLAMPDLANCAKTPARRPQVNHPLCGGGLSAFNGCVSYRYYGLGEGGTEKRSDDLTTCTFKGDTKDAYKDFTVLFFFVLCTLVFFF